MKKLFKRNEGFTLIELLVVIIILAILMAIALPTYLNQQKKAKDSAAKQYLNVAYKAMKSAAVDNSGNWRANATGSSALQKSDITTSEPYLVPVIASVTTLTATGGSSGCTYINTKVSTNGAKAILVGRTSKTNTLYLYSKSDSGRVFALYTTDRSATTGNSSTGSPAYSVIKSSC